MEPFSVIAGVVTTIVLPKILEKASEEIGKKVGEKAVEKSSETLQLVKKTVQNKLEKAGTAGLLTRAEEKPTEQNVQTLQGELVNQMEEDKEFATQLQQLIDQIQAQSPSLQVVLDTVRIRGNVEVGAIEQVSEGGSAEQVVGRNLGVGGDFKMGDITQKVQRNQ